jgi:hypothetical protein
LNVPEPTKEELQAHIAALEKGPHKADIWPQMLPPRTIWDYPVNATMFVIGGLLTVMGVIATEDGTYSLLVIGIVLLIGAGWLPKEK